ncbi:hypothetical protein J7355_16720 [Endozoicomonas sp. G2_2]|uniref:hypothetical protein n=1 Tax=Endozoicomonas sp. G2_2 TaxID=2821092 RepID=UPI001AD975D0|nr:hypothetical protein [Endozoicomonas sp. G2_2]MBO9471736.1 hypothetical protein [Endozoicomonas sp. G2_2]
MSDDIDNNGVESRAHNNPAVERFKKGRGAKATPQEEREQAQADNTSDAHRGPSSPLVDDADSTHSADAAHGDEYDAPAPADRDAASRSGTGRPVFYDNPLEAENSVRAGSAASLVGRVKKAFQPNQGEGESNVFQRLAAHGKAMAAGKNTSRQAPSLERDEHDSSSEQETPIEAQSDREARKQRKARLKANKARQKNQESSVTDEQNRPQSGKGKAPRALAAVLIVGVVGTVAYKAGYEPPFLNSLLGSPSQPSLAGTTNADESTNESGLSIEDEGSANGLPQLAENSSSEQDGFSDDASFGSDGLPELDDRSFSSTPDGVQEEVAMVMDEPLADKEPTFEDMSTYTAIDSTPFYSSAAAENAPAKDDTQDVASTDSKTTSTETAVADADIADAPSGIEDAEAVMPEAVSPSSPDTLASADDGAADADTVEDESGPALAAAEDDTTETATSDEASLVSRLQAVENELHKSQQKIARLERSNRPRSTSARATRTKPDIKLLGISVARYCASCVPLVTVLQDGKTMHLSKGDSFEGYTVDIQGDRLLLVRGSVQHSYYPGS